MKIKSIIIASGKKYQIYDCELNLPSLKVDVKEDLKDKVLNEFKGNKYVHILFSLNGESIEVDLHKMEDNSLFANARQISALNLDKFEIIKKNNLIKKYNKIS